MYSYLQCMAGFWTYSNEMYSMSYKQSSSATASQWSQLYDIINTCNAAINGINKLDDSSFPSVADKTHS